LEIVTTQFLHLVLDRKGLSGTRIKTFLNPQLSLSARVAAMLDITLDRPLEPDLISRVLQAVRWRNDVVHGTGHLPELSEQELREGVGAVLGMALLIAGRRDELAGEPAMQAVTSRLLNELGGGMSRPLPVLRAGSQHRVTADFYYLASSAFPDVNEINAIVNRLAQLLVERDIGFDRNRHLHVRFTTLPNDVRADWLGGRLSMRGAP
jgi:hypothetical protein